uniref:Retrovirus-related Pol polyprotein from transposon TNT 1-94 n=1 Tax=Cajanus cajan TaxID=3821 RepID=A0A151SZW6_CAJCA|nr:Retrovirus-related Pol polyprotein from transposon TNT 1-94 [Cajanus cajan]
MSEKGMKIMASKDKLSNLTCLINRGPSVPLDYQLPEEVWSGKKVNLSHLSVFGCVSYVMINYDSRDKLDPKPKGCYFIGYGSDIYDYRFWDDQNMKIIRSRNVTFNENVFYKDKSIEFVCVGKQPKIYEKVALEEIFESDFANTRQNTEVEIQSKPKPII